MGLTDITSKVQQITNTTGGLLSALFSLLLAAGAIAIVVLSIVMMFCDEQAAQRYKRWRMNVIKAVAVGMCVRLIFALIKGLVGTENWGQAPTL